MEWWGGGVRREGGRVGGWGGGVEGGRMSIVNLSRCTFSRVCSTGGGGGGGECDSVGD